MTRYIKGDYNAVCYECGFQFKASQLKRHWTGVFKCDLCWEPRHSQDLIRVPPPESSLRWTQPPPTDVFVEIEIWEEPIQPPIDNPPPNPGGPGPDPTPDPDPDPTPDPDPDPDPDPTPDPEPDPHQSTLLLDENYEVLTDQADQPLWE